MTRIRNHLLTLASATIGALVVVPAHAASVVKVERSTWGASGVPDYVTMYVYAPDQLAAKPPILVAHHSCGTAVSGYVNSLKGIQAGADKNGFVLILPEATGRNCWDVGTTKSLTHDGGGDTQAVAQMVKYALTKYNGDPARVYAMGGSSGAMMTQALLAVYPDVFRAGSARAGVAAGCWAAGFDATMQWSNSCANGTNTRTAEQWGDGVRAMFAGYTGHRPRLQLFHGDADATINYKNLGESIKEWTNVFGLPAAPTSTDVITTPISMYNRQFWKNACGFTVFEAWTAPGKGHSMNYEEDSILKFFGLDTKGGVDPETECPPGGTGGTGGTGGGGAAGASTSGGSGAGGVPATGGAGSPIST
ncbi:MAG TPA: PHB depolymerase family esterase, partial [Polyangiaceae bacterium]|nr:PHB depolymerase family esterase [Polyangiaceae bacterium]